MSSEPKKSGGGEKVKVPGSCVYLPAMFSAFDRTTRTFRGGCRRSLGGARTRWRMSEIAGEEEEKESERKGAERGGYPGGCARREMGYTRDNVYRVYPQKREL